MISLVQVVEYTLVLGAIAFAGLLVRRISGLDLTLSSLLAGIVAGWLVQWLGIDTGIRAHNVKDLVFFIILPLLIFSASWQIDIHQFKRWFGLCLLLATLGLLLSTGLTALMVYFAVDHPTGFPWVAALLVGVMLSATDPVSVAEQLKQARAPHSLQTLFEGESLLNDATAVVLFGVFLSYALALVSTEGGASVSSTSVLGTFLLVFVGGLLVGSLLGLLAARLIEFLADPPASVIILVLMSFASFYLAEHLLHVSGILAVMMCAVISRLSLKNHSSVVLKGVESTWEWLGVLLNALIFSLMGLMITWNMFTDQWLAMLIAVAAALCARILSVYAVAGFSRLTSCKLSLSWANLLVWGGLKGAIAIVLVLSIPVELDYWWTLQSMVFAVVLFSILLQGTTFPALLRRSLK